LVPALARQAIPPQPVSIPSIHKVEQEKTEELVVTIEDGKNKHGMPPMA